VTTICGFVCFQLFYNTMAAHPSVNNHKSNYARFVNPDYARVEQVNGYASAQQFQQFLDALLAELPDEGAPADGYMYNSHMGALVRTLDEAKDHWIKAKLAFYAKRGSGGSGESSEVGVKRTAQLP
jgi:hypothetical protein